MTVLHPRFALRRRSAALLSGAVVGSLLLATGAGGTAAATEPELLAASVSPTADDTDGDALLDVWETDGYDADADGDIDVDLPAMGANPLRKDIFVEMDYMGAEETCPCHLPLAPDLQRIETTFAQSPRANNPDGSRGITIHLDAGPARGAEYDLGGGNLVAHDDDLNPVEDEFYALKAANFDSNRDRIFHYMIWGHRYSGGTSSGLSFGLGADSFIVTLGAFAEHGTSNNKVGTFIHELGHNLDLGHGGIDDTNYKPNYPSVMRYGFQLDGIPRADGKPPLFSYSNKVLPTLREDRLNEQVGINDPLGEKYRTKWWCGASLMTSPGAARGPIDWNCDSTISASRISADINGDGAISALVGAQDWGNLVFDGGAIGAGSAAVSSVERPVEMTYEQYVAERGR